MGRQRVTPEPRRRRRIDERVTRFLCATVHLDTGFANHAWGVLLFPGRQGQAPEQEIDPIAVARHTILALGRRKRRDQLLAIVLGCVIFAGVVIFRAGFESRISMGEVAWWILALPLVGWFVALAIVFHNYSEIRTSAIHVFAAKKPARTYAPALDKATEDRLKQVHESNTAIFNTFVPFVGTGHTLDTWKLTLHTNPERRTVAGSTRTTPGTFVFPEQVHHHLMRDVPEVLKNVQVERRLYVDGGTATTVLREEETLQGRQVVERLVPVNRGIYETERPLAVVSAEMLDMYTAEPTRTARTYVAFIENSGNGDIVVTVLVRAEMIGNTVYVEGRSQVLLPTQPGFKDVYWVSRRPDQAFLPVLRTAVPATTGLWLESPIRLVRYWLGGRSDKRTIKLEGQRIERGQPVNYGVGSSLREDVMLPADPGYYGSADEVMYFRVITQEILDSLCRFLEERGVRTPDFDEQRQLIVEQTFNVDGIRNEAPKGTANYAL
jgi:hypothetical protein